MSRSIQGTGLIVHVESSTALILIATNPNEIIPTLAGIYEPGARVLNRSTSIWYTNVGTTALPVFSSGDKDTQVNPATIATTGNADAYLIVPETGLLSSIDFSGVDALAASDTNFITFTVTNLGQAGAGSTAMLASTPAGINTTKVTGGTAIAANTKYPLTLSAVAGALAVTAGDRLRIRAAVTGTLANTVTFPAYQVRVTGASF